MWILSSYGDQDDPQPVIEQHRTLFAIFDAGGVHGNTGCNSFNYTSVTRGWREISVDPSLMVTMVLCQGATRRQEQALLSTLSGAESYHIWNGTLRIFSTDDRVLTFVGEKAHGSPEPRSPSIA